MRRKLNRQKGQTALMFTFVVTAMFGTVGLVTDVGWAYYRQQTAYAAAQAAALAAVKAAISMSGGSCGTNNVVCQSETSCPANINANGTLSNIDEACLYAQSNGYTTAGRQKVTVQSGTGTYDGVSVSYWAVVKVSEQLPQMFSAVLGNTMMNITARSSVGYVPPYSGGCIYVTAGSGAALTTNGNTQITTGCGIVVNSNDPTSAINLSGGNTSITDTNANSKVQIVGGYSCYGQTTGCISPAPVTGAQVADDPLLGLDPPTASSCTPIPSFNGNGGQPVALSPGTYCGNVSLQGSQKLSMSPGNYIFKSGGANSCGLSASGNAQISGSGVFMYFQDNCSVSFTGNGAIDLSAPSSGDYQGILFYQSRTDTNASSLTGGSSQVLNGILYFPDATLHYAGGSSSNINAPASTIIAYNLELDGSSYIWNQGTSPYLNTFSGYAIIE